MTKHPGLWTLSCLLMACFSLLACDKQDNSAAPSTTALRPVKTLVIASRLEPEWRELPGVVDAFKKAELSFSIAGKLTKLNKQEGDVVEQGQALAILDQTELKTLVIARQADYEKAKADFNRAKLLIDKNHISKSDYDQLRAQYESARANLSIAKQNLDNSVLKAVFSGRIAKRHVDNFEEVAAKQSIYTLHDTRQLLIEINVPESAMIRVRENKNRKIYATFSAIPNKLFPLKLHEVSTQAESGTNTYRVTFSMPEIKDANILPGMSAMVKVDRSSVDSDHPIVAIIPAIAVLSDQDGPFVYLVNSSDGRTGTVEKHAVTTGKLTNLGLEITQGLNPGDRVVVGGVSKMHQGLSVALMP